MFFRRLRYKWRRWRLMRRQEKRGKGVSHHVLRDHSTLLDRQLLTHYQPSLGMTITIHGACQHFSEAMGRLTDATRTIRDGAFVHPSRNQFNKVRRKRLDDYLVDESDRPLTMEETLSILIPTINDYHEAMEAVNDENRSMYYHRQYSRLNQEALEITSALIKVMDHG